MKKLKSYLYWTKHPCTKKFCWERDFGSACQTVGWGPHLKSRRSFSSKAGDVNMKHFAQTLTAGSFARDGSLARPPTVLANPKARSIFVGSYLISLCLLGHSHFRPMSWPVHGGAFPNESPSA